VNNAPLAVVTGASGFVGSHIVDDLLARGVRVRAVVRGSSSRRWLNGKGIEFADAAMEDEAALGRAVAGADWVVHAAGLIRARNAAEFHECNVAGTERILRASREASVRRFVLVSSQAAAGPSPDGRPIAEDSAPRPVSAYGESKLAAERAVLGNGTGAARAMGVTVVRPPAVYGPRDTAILKVFALAKRHIEPVLRRRGRFSMIHVVDLASAIHVALTRDAAAGELFFASEPDETDYEELGKLVREALGTWTVRIAIPRWALMGVALGAETVAAIARQAPLLSREKLREISAGDWVCSSRKIRERLGWSPRIPLREGIRATADWYREAGWL
jgi:nucleoside-diphosphate-sugar epimerase